MLENPDFLSKQIISYRGNKRKLLSLLNAGLAQVYSRVGRRQLRILDAFAGSGICSRFFKQHASLLVSNDLQPYSTPIAQCFLSNRSEVNLDCIHETIALLDREKLNPQPQGFIERHYAPNDDENIQKGERVFFTNRNARILDNVCRALQQVDPSVRPFVLGPLMAETSIRSNTAGHFKGFLKSKHSKIGSFAGSASRSVKQVTTDIVIREPILSRFECEVLVCCHDAIELADELEDLDVAYFDPPYDDQPYGLLYFMLNFLVNYEEPTQISRVSGVPHDWIRSSFSRKRGTLELLNVLIEKTQTRFVLLSYSNEGSIASDDIEEMLNRFGSYTVVEQDHPRFNSANHTDKHGTHGKRNSRRKVLERLYVLEKR